MLVMVDVRPSYQGKSAQKEPRFERFPDNGGTLPTLLLPSVQTTSEPDKHQATLLSGALTASVNTGPDAFAITFGTADGQKLTDIGWNSLAWGTSARANTMQYDLTAFSYRPFAYREE